MGGFARQLPFCDTVPQRSCGDPGCREELPGKATMGEGFQRATRAATLTRYPGTPAAAPRQVWADNDSRANGREVRIDSIEAGYAHCTVIAGAAGTHVSGKGTARILLSRFIPNATGYRFLRTLPAEE